MSESTKGFVPGVTEDVNITDGAVEEAKRLMSENKVPDGYALRIGIKGGGCSGFIYKVGFDAKSRPTDIVIEKRGLKVLVDMKSYLYLLGTEIDFTDSEDGRGFVFDNPNAGRTCVCSSSFGE
jgi:iron-sulfur cluster assembly protein